MKKRKQSLSFRNKNITFLLLSVGIFAGLSAFGYGLYKTKDINDTDIKSSAASNPLADLNADNNVNIQDLSILISKWGTNAQPADINKDGTVSIQDLSILISSWGPITITQTQAGANLPINYDIAGLPGTKRYVATNGNDTSGNGSIGSPYQTIKKAESVSVDGDTIIVRGGTYKISDNAFVIDRNGLTITAYPNEIPVFDGSIKAPVSVGTEGTLKYFSYQPVPAGVGEGVVLANLPSATFSGTNATGQASERGWRCTTGSSTYTVPAASTVSDPSGCGAATPKVMTGYYPDQVWVGGQQLIQVLDKSKVGPGKFWLDRTSATDANPGVTNLYISATNATDMSKVSVSSSKGMFLQVSAGNVKISGIKIINHSPVWSQYALLLNNNNATVENVEFDSNAGTAIKVARGSSLSTLASGNTFKNITVSRSGWVGTVLYYNDDTTFNSVSYEKNDPFLEFFSSPQRGAIKITKSDRTRILTSAFTDNGSMAVWFDQSNYKADLYANKFTGNADSAVFYEISHDLTMVDNYISSPSNSINPAVRLAGASGLKIVNNTIIGGKDTVALLTDARSKKYEHSPGDMRDCSEHKLRYGLPGDSVKDCWVSYTSDYDVARPGAYSPTGATNLTPGMDWNNSVDVFINNILANPTGSGQCASIVPFCVVGYLNWNSSLGLIHQQVDMNKMFSTSTVMDGNIYQSTSGSIFKVRIDTSVSQPGGFVATDINYLKGTQGFGSAYYGLNIESKGLSGASGLVDSTGLVSGNINHINAFSVPTDSDINKYIPAGTKHYGVTYK